MTTAAEDGPEASAEPVASGLPAVVWKVAGVATIGSFMAQLDAALVNVSLSSLSADLHASLSTIQWVMSGYLLALALVLPINGWLVDRIGAKAVYLWSFAAFTAASGLCGGAWSAGSLISFRVLQGMSGGLLAPMAQMMVARVAGKQMARVASIIAVPILLAPLLGPVAAGAILRVASWRWLFLINLPVGLLAFVLALLFLPPDRDEARPRSLDAVGLALLSPGLILLLFGADRARGIGGGVMMAAAAMLLATYGFWSRRKGADALVDLRLFRIGTFATATAAMFLVNGVTFAGQMLIPLFLTGARGISPTETGWLMMPLGAGMICTYPFVGRLTERFGARAVSSCGAILALAGTLPLVLLARSDLSIPILVATLFLRGVGMGAVGVPANSSGYAAVPREDLSTAATAMNIGQRIGGSAWTTICAAFLAWRSAAGSSADAYLATFGLLSIMHLCLLAVVARLPRVWAGRSADPA